MMPTSVCAPLRAHATHRSPSIAVATLFCLQDRRTPPLRALILCQVPSSSPHFNPGSGCLCDPTSDPQALLNTGLGQPGALEALLSTVPHGALAHLQKLSVPGLCLSLTELQVLSSGTPRLTCLDLPPTATLAWIPKLASLEHLQQLTIEYIPETSTHSAADALAAAGIPGANGPTMHVGRTLETVLLSQWACRRQLRSLVVRRRRTLCRGDMYRVLAPQLSALSGLTRLTWAELVPRRAWAGSWTATLAESLRTLSSLRHLEISVGPDGDLAGVSRFADALGWLTRLTMLDLTICSLDGVADALRCMPELRNLSVKVHVRKECCIGACMLLDALPHLPALTSLGLTDDRTWRKLRPCRPRHTLPCFRVHAHSSGGRAGSLRAGAPCQLCDRSVVPMEVSHGSFGQSVPDECLARHKLLQVVAKKFEMLAGAVQLEVLRLDVPFMGDVVCALSPQLPGLHRLQRLELAKVGERYHSAKRVLWPHVVGLPLRDGVRLW